MVLTEKNGKIKKIVMVTYSNTNMFKTERSFWEFLYIILERFFKRL